MAGRGPPYYQRGGTSSNPRGDLYQQLIDNNELVRELDDIEAISQQISQHAEVLYQNWKQNTVPRLGNTPSQSGPSDIESNGSTTSLNGGPLSRTSSREQSAQSNTLPTRLHHQIAQAQQQSLGSPTFASSSSGSSDYSSRASTLPNRSNTSGRSVTQIYSDFDIDIPSQSNPTRSGGNGNLKDLVNSFVSTDRAKQAARNTISSTITNMRSNGNGNGLRSPSPSSSTSSFSSRGMSPLKSPMLAISSVPMPGGPLSPTSSISSSYGSQRSSNPRFNSAADIHTQLTPIFGGGSSGGGGSNPGGHRSVPFGRDAVDRPALSLKAPSSGWHNEPPASSGGRIISIPVQHLTATASTPSGLQSPQVLQNISSSQPTTFPPRRSSNRNSMEFDMPLPSLHAANVERIRLRFEEAKQRMHLMHQRAMESGFLTSRTGTGASPGFNSVKNAFERIADDGEPEFVEMEDSSNLILDQLRRRSNRREIPFAPHPELTPQQKQHIMERSSMGPHSGSTGFGSTGFPFRRFLGGGSVAERVLIFERCPVFQTSESKDDGFKTIPIEKHIDPVALHRKSAPELTFAGTPAPGTSPPSSQVSSFANRGSAFASGSSPPGSSPLSTLQIRSNRDIPIAKGAQITPILSKSPPSVSPIHSPVPTTTFASSVLGSRSITPPKVVTPPPLGRPRSLVIEGTAATKGRSLPKFHFPFGNPALSQSVELSLKPIHEEFRKHKKSTVSQKQLGLILRKCGYHLSWKGILFNAAVGDKAETISFDQFSRFWRKMLADNHDEASQFIYILTRGLRKYLVPEDFVPLIQDVVDTHSGLGFLKEATEFHSRYVHTVIARIFYCVNRSWSGKITIPEMRRSNFLPILRLLEEEDDINQITDFFSYEHFYVIYCKFWELDKDHDLFIDREDLSRHNDHALSTRMIDRIFSGAVTRGQAQKEGKMSYTEFVWFLLAEEDKRHPTSIEYW
eukprot:maker-scaffold429_size173697-snap-gene-0.35 protein:Tk09734 transcript:maker-scaffold429_size173697-snap-gene-0.35-mRNA-1 annotation:"hypothetical protein D910_10866"